MKLTLVVWLSTIGLNWPNVSLASMSRLASEATRTNRKWPKLSVNKHFEWNLNAWSELLFTFVRREEYKKSATVY